MNIDKTFDILKDKLPRLVVGCNTNICFITTNYGNNVFNPMLVVSDLKKRVTSIAFTTSDTNILFNTETLPGVEFAKNFVENYKIPQMEVVIGGAKPQALLTCGPNSGGLDGWQYISPNGFKLFISDDKCIWLESVVKSSEMKFD